MKFRRVYLAAFVFAIAVSASLLAQDTASITGTVTDPSGAAVKDAQVVVSSPDRGLDRTTTTNDSRDFLVACLPPGPVNMTVTAAGHTKHQAQRVILRVGHNARRHVTLPVRAT